MVKEILVCLEASQTSERAVDLAIHLARQLHATLVGLGIVDETDIRAAVATGIGGGAYKQQRDDVLVKDAEIHSREWLQRFAERCIAEAIPARSLEMRGRPAVMIVEESAHHDLTVMGRHVNFRFETDVQDRETRDFVLHRVRKPVIVVPEDEVRLEGPVVLAYDGSSAAKRAVQSFAECGLAGSLGPIHVITVDDDGTTAWETASKAVETLAAHSVRATQHSVVSTLPIADAILKESGRLGARMLVSGAYATSRITEFFWGSVTRTLIEKTTVPLYLHH